MAFAVQSSFVASGLAPLPVGRRTRKVAQAGAQDEIYLGFPKEDTDRTPGRKGRVVRDDPRKYPGRDDLGPLRGVVGGWAGGEAALRKQIDQYKSDQSKNGKDSQSQYLAPSSPVRVPTKNKWGAKPQTRVGRDAIYVGFAKDELDLKKSGAQGRVIFDEAFKYPGREDLGPFKSVIGGFAGGEAALKTFAETGELKIRKPGDPIPRRQFSPLSLAFLVCFAVVGGSLLITSVLDLAEDPSPVAETAAAVSGVAQVTTEVAAPKL